MKESEGLVKEIFMSFTFKPFIINVYEGVKDFWTFSYMYKV